MRTGTLLSDVAQRHNLKDKGHFDRLEIQQQKRRDPARGKRRREEPKSSHWSISENSGDYLSASQGPLPDACIVKSQLCSVRYVMDVIGCDELQGAMSASVGHCIVSFSLTKHDPGCCCYLAQQVFVRWFSRLMGKVIFPTNNCVALRHTSDTLRA